MLTRLAKIAKLYFEIALEYRSRSFVWFLISLVNPLILLIYWLGYFKSHPESDLSLSAISTYYLLLIIAGALLMSHVEEEVGYEDIQLGYLSRYLVLPISYILLQALGEIPWRVIQGFFAAVIFALSTLFFNQYLNYSLSMEKILPAIFICLLAYLLSFIFKMAVGLSAFWLIEFHGLNELLGVIILLFAGYIMPLNYYPSQLQTVALNLPFAYMIYYPVTAMQGNLVSADLTRIILMQVFYIAFFYVLYRFLWKLGVKRFTGMGN